MNKIEKVADELKRSWLQFQYPNVFEHWVDLAHLAVEAVQKHYTPEELYPRD